MKEYKITKYKEAIYKKAIDMNDTELHVYGPEDMQVSDGLHTMDELYEHRITLFITLARFVQSSDEVAIDYGGIDRPKRVWRSKLHSDGGEFEGWFIMGIGKEAGEMITYHLPIGRWDETEFAETLANAPEWDGHTSEDVLERLKNL